MFSVVMSISTRRSTPLEVVEEHYFGPTQSVSLRKQYRNSDGAFTAPLMHFQRPTARFDEPALFASAIGKLHRFIYRTDKAFDAANLPLSPDAKEARNNAIRRAGEIEFLRDNWFNFVKRERDGRGSFQGVMTRDTYTKAASLACVRDMIPPGKMTLVGEQEGTMGRVVPHIFREDILHDRFEWAIVSFDKEASSDWIDQRKDEFHVSFDAWREARPHLSYRDALQAWAAANTKPAFRLLRDGTRKPWPGSNFASKAYPRLWLRSPVPRANEVDKVVGFPILSPRFRTEYRRRGIDDVIQDPELQEAITRRMTMATLQPVSIFQNALRNRVSIVERAGGRSARKGSSYVNGSAYNPRVLIAMLNIWRIYYNFFDWRTYASPDEDERTAQEEDQPATPENDEGEINNGTARAVRRLKVPGTNKTIEVPLRRKTRIRRTTPAMRMGVHSAQYSDPQSVRSDEQNRGSAEPKREPDEVQQEILQAGEGLEPVDKKKDRRRDDRPRLPNLSRILYQPWLFHGTPMWGKLQGR